MNANSLSINEYSSHIVFITGGTKSGKSEFAEYLAKKVKKLSYVAYLKTIWMIKNGKKKLIYIRKGGQKIGN